MNARYFAGFAIETTRKLCLSFERELKIPRMHFNLFATTFAASLSNTLHKLIAETETYSPGF